MIPAHAFRDALSQFCAVEHGVHETARIVSGTPLPTLNGVFSFAPAPDISEVARLAAGMPTDAPWSIQVRGEPSPDLVEIAAGHGLTGRRSAPMMLCPAAALRLGTAAARTATVRRISSADVDLYAEVLTAGFGAPREILGPMLAPHVLDRPKTATYLVEDGGLPVATGLGVLSGDVVTIFNVTTVPGHRRTGHGRLVTETIMREAFAGGATRAFLQSSEEGLPLYTSMGFRVVEHWTYLTA